MNVLAISGPTVYAGGDFGRVGGQGRHNIAALDGATGVATAWNPNPDGDVRALAMFGQTVYAGGDFERIGGEARNRIAALGACPERASGGQLRQSATVQTRGSPVVESVRGAGGWVVPACAAVLSPRVEAAAASHAVDVGADGRRQGERSHPTAPFLREQTGAGAGPALVEEEGVQALRPAAAVLGQRHGVSWQIVPTRLFELLRDPDRQKAKRVTEAMLQMRKLDIGGLERATAQD